jgi:hypothetical protein
MIRLRILDDRVCVFRRCVLPNAGCEILRSLDIHRRAVTPTLDVNLSDPVPNKDAPINSIPFMSFHMTAFLPENGVLGSVRLPS